MPSRLRLIMSALILISALAVAVWQGVQDRPSQTPTRTTDWYQVSFTTPSDTPTNVDDVARGGSLDTQLVALLNEAQRSIDLAAYEFDLENVAQALAAAQQRGVRVRMVTDSDTLESEDPATQRALAIVQSAAIPIVADGRSAIMHHKFVVVDDTWVWTGSWERLTGSTR